MAKVSIVVEIDEKKLIGEVKAELKRELIDLVRGEIFKKVKDRSVFIDGLIQSGVTNEIKNLLTSSTEIKGKLNNVIANVEPSQVLAYADKVTGKDLDSRIDRAIELKINTLINLKQK